MGKVASSVIFVVAFSVFVEVDSGADLVFVEVGTGAVLAIVVFSVFVEVGTVAVLAIVVFPIFLVLVEVGTAGIFLSLELDMAVDEFVVESFKVFDVEFSAGLLFVVSTLVLALPYILD